jgi:predicted AlkP superfamily phosphohydrolase/phosphomutase
MGAKVLFVGLDSVEPDILERWVGNGTLPNLQSLKSRGQFTQIATNPAIGDGAFWASVYTGVNLARHGRYFFRQTVPGTYYEKDFNEDEHLAYPPFWKTLSEHGKRVAVVDVFRAPLTPDINGIQVADWCVHGTKPGNTRSFPADLAATVIARYGPDPFNGRIDSYLQTNPDIIAATRLLENRIRTKTRMCQDLLKEDSWDLLFTVFGEAHDIGHVAWHRHDSKHPLFDRKWAEEHGDPIKTVYVALDEAIGALAASVGQQTHIALLAGLGMEPACTANYVLDRILLRLELGSIGRHIQRTQRLYKRALTGVLQPLFLRAEFPGQGVRPTGKSERAQRKCFSVPHNEHAGAIRLNILGREPNGKLRRGKESETFSRQLEKQLLRIQDTVTGERLVKEIIRSEDVFTGKRQDSLPDMFVIWNRVQPFSTIASPALGKIDIELPSRRTGDHSHNAVFGVFGCGMNSAASLGRIVPEDIAPTVSSLLGVSLKRADGCVIQGLKPSSNGKPLTRIRPTSEKYEVGHTF